MFHFIILLSVCFETADVLFLLMETTCSCHRWSCCKHLLLITLHFECLWFQFLFLSPTVITFSIFSYLLRVTLLFPRHVYFVRRVSYINCDKTIAKSLLLLTLHPLLTLCSPAKCVLWKTRTLGEQHMDMWGLILIFCPHPQTLEMVPRDSLFWNFHLWFTGTQSFKGPRLRESPLCNGQDSSRTHSVPHHAFSSFILPLKCRPTLLRVSPSVAPSNLPFIQQELLSLQSKDNCLVTCSFQLYYYIGPPNNSETEVRAFSISSIL